MRLIVISGLSGSGKSVGLKVLEDAGFYCIDNLPADLLSQEAAHLEASGCEDVDIGTGYGVPASWLLERFTGARLHGIEPSPERVRIAAMAVGERGLIVQGQAPAIPAVEDPVDLSTMIDMVHFLTDEDFNETLGRLQERTRRREADHPGFAAAEAALALGVVVPEPDPAVVPNSCVLSARTPIAEPGGAVGVSG